MLKQIDRSRIGFYVTLLIIAAALMALFFYRPAAKPSDVGASAESSTSARQDAVSPAAQGDSRPPPASGAFSPSDPMIEDFAESHFGRFRAIDEWNEGVSSEDPDKVLAAVRAAKRCREHFFSMKSNAQVPESDGKDLEARRQKARSILERYCDGMSTDDNHFNLTVGLVKRGAGLGNAALAVEARIEDYKASQGNRPFMQPDDFCSTLKLARSDLETVRSLVPFVQLSPRTQLFGEQLSADRKIAFGYALDIYACRSSGNCGPRDWRLISACASDGLCRFESVVDAYLSPPPNGAFDDVATQRMAVELSEKIAISLNEPGCPGLFK